MIPKQQPSSAQFVSITTILLLLLMVQVAWSLFSISSSSKMVDETQSIPMPSLGHMYEPTVSNHVHKRLPPIIDARSVGIFNGCIASDRMQFIYIKTAKSAGSTTLLWVQFNGRLRRILTSSRAGVWRENNRFQKVVTNLFFTPNLERILALCKHNYVEMGAVLCFFHHQEPL